MSDVAAARSMAEPAITGEQLARMPGLGRCELVDGRIVAMSPTSDEHGRVELCVGAILRDFVRPRGLGRVRVGEVGIYTRRDPDRVRGADVIYISNERYAQRDVFLAFLDIAPDLVVEILSPRDAAMDLAEKIREYFAIGVRMVWVIDPRARRVLVYRTATALREFGEGERLPGDDVLPGLEIPVADLFEE